MVRYGHLALRPVLLKKCLSCGLESCPIFSFLRETELSAIEKIKKCFLLKKGAVLFSEGDANGGFYIVRSGLLKVYKSCWRGPNLTFRFAKPGDIVDLASYRDERNSVSIESLGESRVCFFETKPLDAFLSRFPRVALELLSRACRELKVTRYKTLDIIYHPVASRLAHLLLYLRDAGLGVYLSREEMAQAVGCSLETMIRLVSQLRKKGVIKIKNRELSIADPNALTSLTDGRLNHGWQ